MSNKPASLIGKKRIGQGEAPLFLPDIDVYFKHDIQGAYRLVNALISAGITTLKGALLHNPDMCLPEGEVGYFVPGTGMRRERYRDVIERHVVPLDTLRRIYSDARDQGLELVLSVYDEEGLQLALELEAVALKIPSSNIVHAPLIRSVAATGRVLMLDTGRSTMDEIDRAVEWAKASGAQTLIVQHSPPGPPAPPTDFNLNMMIDMGRKYQCHDSLSDHFRGIEMLLAATALGVDVLEKGVCLDESKPDIDIAHALPISQIGETLEKIALIDQAMGSTTRTLPVDRPVPPDRMCLVAKSDLEPGARISPETIRFAFPQQGIPVERWDDFVGKPLAHAVKAGAPITEQDV
ncbi:N-acetylneuraminate synthase family protein [Vampirovibrio chlorellavorus]|uniref:N-acetylneuraminate synthase family protein n=1 Tax=Vampirovibrio chlorellavorus TaxID=758823 RepID=UPI0026F021DF|nr:N-acetylneuraminate synthase family protein [Vampirovibrio chlorellavorus]